jgi:hypothetical protein
MEYIGIVGSRRRNTQADFEIVEKEFFEIYTEGDWIISGGCPKGADNFAEQIAKKYGIPILIFPANWKKFGRRAGFVRNTDIAKISTKLIAEVAEDRKGGTEDTISKFIKFQHGQDVNLYLC